ncbi:MAG: gliding motility-associated C-terminal domain-containing protein [Opitutaceae bacterium]|nr:gliding motility-associated C-terminal domain-containing protein [Cytophagales bacterium]
MSDIPATQADSAMTRIGPHGNPNRNNKGHVIEVSFEGSSQDFKIATVAPEITRYHFIKGKSNWVNDAKAFKEVRLNNFYDGIDLKLYFKDNLLKYDFVVNPGKDPSKIKVRYEGADSLYLEDGHLVINTSIGKIYEKPPYTYQTHHGKLRQVPCKFKLSGLNLSFELPGHYDHKLPLIIDPELIFSTYSGSTADNFGNTATYDDSGNMYTGGIIFDNGNLPTTPGPLDTFHGIADYDFHMDAFIMKYSADGKALLQAVYLGGVGNEYPISMIVNKANELIILGITGSSDFPVTQLAFDTTFNGGEWFDTFFNFKGTALQGDTITEVLGNGSDIFITKLSADSFLLRESTYLGGSGNDGVQISKTPCVKNYGDQVRGEVMTDNQGNIYLASHTYSQFINGVPLIGNLNVNNGLQDALVVKFNPDLSSVLWSRLIGGAGYESGLGIRVDSLNQVYIAGGSTSSEISGLPLTGINKSNSGNVDGYIVKLSSDGNTILASTFLGTPFYDQCYFIDLDSDLNVYVTGQTKGLYPVSPNVYSNPNSGQFIHVLNNDLSTSLVSTVFGSGSQSPDISLTAFLVNNCRKIFISGWGGRTNNSFDTIGTRFGYIRYSTGYINGKTFNMPITSDAFQKTSDGDGFYFIIFHPEAKTLAYATHFGGLDGTNREHVDGGTSRFDKKGIIYQSVCSGCGGYSNFPTPNPNVWSLTNNSTNCNNASLKFDLGKVIAKFETFDSLKNIPSIYGCVPLTFFIKNKSSGATNYKWNVGNGVFFEKNDSLFLRFSQRGKQNITLIAFDTTICRLTDTARAVVNAGDVKVDFAPDKVACSTASFIPDTKLYTPWAKVNWSPTTGVSDPTSPNPTITTSVDMKYLITVSDDTLCVKSDTLNVKVRKTTPSIDFKILDSDKIAEKYTFCYPNKAFFRNLSKDYDYLEWRQDGYFLTEIDSFNYNFPKPGKMKYSLKIFDTICHKTYEQSKFATLSQPLVTFPDDIIVCPDSIVNIKIDGDPDYKYSWQPKSLFADTGQQVQTIKINKPGTIFISVKDSLGCEIHDTVNYDRYSIPNLINEKNIKICYQKYGGAEIASAILKDYLWEPTKYTGNPYFVTSKGIYILSGHTTDGCPVRDTVNVVEKCDPELHVPTAFTPNGDGNNDLFSVFGHEVETFDIKVFNRWGELIYHSSDFRFKWDGTYKNQTVPIGTYPYVISWQGSTFEGDIVSKTFSGDITVVK